MWWRACRMCASSDTGSKWNRWDTMMGRTFFLATLFGAASLAQPPDFGFGGRGFGPGGPGGPGGPMGGTRKVLDQFDKDKKGYLNAAERKAAREYLATQPRRGRGGPGGGFGGGGGAPVTVEPGPKLSPDKVRIYDQEPLYDIKVVRTLFLEFEDPDWEQELMDFYRTDVEVPAR